MLRSIIYFNILYLLILSIYLLIESKKNKKRIKEVLIIFVIYNIFSIILCNSEIVELNWNTFLIIPVSILSLILNVISICITNKVIKKQKTEKNNRSLLYLFITIIPVILFVFAYSFELYVINKCDYILKYNYQNGIIISEDTYIAIINNKPLSVTLQKNIFDRNGKQYEGEEYKAIYNDEVEISIINSNYKEEIVDNRKIKEVALAAKEKNKDAKSAYVYYLPEGEYTIIKLLSGKDSGTILGEYFYYNGKYIKSIETNGNLESVIYYE